MVVLLHEDYASSLSKVSLGRLELFVASLTFDDNYFMKITCYFCSDAKLSILQCFQINQMLEAPVAKKAKLRHHNDDFIMFGFVSVDAKPMCLECGVTLTNDSTKKVKLLHHQESKRPSSVGKDREYFERKKKIQPVKLFDFVKKMSTANAKTLKPSYLV